MSIAKMMTREGWEHSEGEERIEEICVQTRDLTDRRLSILALRFISVKGLSGEFADALEEAIEAEAGKDTPSP